MGLPLRSPVAKLSCEAATEENAKRRSFMPRTQVTGKANFSPGITSCLPVILAQSGEEPLIGCEGGLFCAWRTSQDLALVALLLVTTSFTTGFMGGSIIPPTDGTKL